MLLAYHRENYRGVRFDPDVDSIETLAPSLSRQLSLQRRIRRIEIALHNLPLDLQMLTEARYIQDYNGSELAEMFKIPEGTVHSRLHRARQLMNEILKRWDPRDGEGRS